METRLAVGKKYQPAGKSYSDGTVRDAKDFITFGQRVPILTPVARSLSTPIASEFSARGRRLNGYAGGFTFSFTKLAMTRISSAGSTGFARCVWKPARSARTRSLGCT